MRCCTLNGAFMKWFIETFPLESTFSFLDDLVLLLKDSGPVSSLLGDAFLSRDFTFLINYNFDYSAMSLEDVVSSRQIHAFVYKNKDIDIGLNLEQISYEKFCECEIKCREMNHLFRSQRSLDCECESILFLARSKIAKILGDVPTLQDLDLAFGPGANIGVSSKIACPRTKLSAELTCSRTLFPHAAALLSEMPLLVAHHANLSDKDGLLSIQQASGKLVFVPKDARSHRSILVEPLLNSILQKGIGTHLKTRLLKAGVDLYDQTRNQRLACEGSIDGHLCTIDLSSASDLISYGVVLDLLPMPWFELLESARTESYTYNNRSYSMEKFSGMGNAFTFELESLIFYSLTWACCKYMGLSASEVSVYGDDIIAPSQCFKTIEKIFICMGFVINTKKSYFDGPFRESCGADYFEGFNVRPFFLKEVFSYRVIYIMHNWFVRACELNLATLALSFVPADKRIFGPDGFGDGHLIGHFEPYQNRKIKRCQYDGIFFQTISFEKRRYTRPLLGDWLLPSYICYRYGSDESTPTDEFVVRGRGSPKLTLMYTLNRTLFSGS
jgi:hypothetical protein